MSNPVVFMLIGVPGSGKSTYAKQFLELYPNFVYISTDHYVQKYAYENATTYDAVWSNMIGEAETFMNTLLEESIRDGKNIIWDQTNLSVKNRAKKLSKFPDNYRKVAVFFEVPSKENHKFFLYSSERAGKNIPENVVENMINSIQRPTREEGFDDIFTYSIENK